MDDKKFDLLARELASGESRRSVLKGALGLGSAVAALQSLTKADIEAARRPTPTPKPIRCPGIQIAVSGVCQCPDAHAKCGSDCCPDGISECCDGACCYGTCMGEELCCATENVCAGNGSPDLCCAGGTTCCDGGTATNRCVEGSCVEGCAPGSQPDGEGGCLLCPAGTASADGLLCVSCTDNSYASGSGNTICSSCDCFGTCETTTGACDGTQTPGEECTGDSDCVTGTDCSDTSGICCVAQGSNCTEDFECCSGNCDMHSVPYVTFTCEACIPDGFAEQCYTDSQCCNGVCSTFSFGMRLCGTCIPSDENFPCRLSSECCNGTCVPSGHGYDTCVSAPV